MQMCERSILYRRLLYDDRLLDIAEDLIGPNLQLFHDQALYKPPRHGGPIHWHQDNGYWKCLPANLVSCWLTLDDVDVHNGAMHLIPGSHLRPERHERQEGTPLFDLGGQVDAERAEVVELPAGGVMFHHCQALHHTPRNKTGRERRAFAIHYMNPGTRSLRDGRVHAGELLAAPAQDAHVERGDGMKQYHSRMDFLTVLVNLLAVFIIDAAALFASSKALVRETGLGSFGLFIGAVAAPVALLLFFLPGALLPRRFPARRPQRHPALAHPGREHPPRRAPAQHRPLPGAVLGTDPARLLEGKPRPAHLPVAGRPHRVPQRPRHARPRAPPRPERPRAAGRQDPAAPGPGPLKARQESPRPGRTQAPGA